MLIAQEHKTPGRIAERGNQQTCYRQNLGRDHGHRRDASELGRRLIRHECERHFRQFAVPDAAYPLLLPHDRYGIGYATPARHTVAKPSRTLGTPPYDLAPSSPRLNRRAEPLEQPSTVFCVRQRRVALRPRLGR
jgi:hypothetical protein